MSYFIGILRGIGDIFLPKCSQVLSLLNVGSRAIFKSHKNPVQRGKSCYIYIYIHTLLKKITSLGIFFPGRIISFGFLYFPVNLCYCFV